MIVEVQRLRPGHVSMFVCVSPDGKETTLPIPAERRAFAPTLALLRSAYGTAFAVLEWHGNKKSRIGLSEDDAYSGRIHV